jgi:LysR family hca operon transcriptional activator
MELRHLRYFLAVAEAGSLTEAAERRLHTSQPSLSRQIRDLEHEVGAELLSRSVHGVELTAAGRAFADHARLALVHADAAAQTARRAAQPARPIFAIGFQTGHEMTWLPRAMHVLRDELKNIQVTISSDYSPDLAEALARGRLDLAFLRVEPGYDLAYHVVDREPLIVLMPSDHRLTAAKQCARKISWARYSSPVRTRPPCCARSPKITCAARDSTSSPITGWTTSRWPSPWSHPPEGWR